MAGDDDDYFDDIDVDALALARAAEEAERRARRAQGSSSAVAGSSRGGGAGAPGGSGGGGGGGEGAQPKVLQPVPQKVARSGSSAIIVSQRQKGNPVLNYIKNVPWEYGDIVPDYVVGQTACALFLSLKYHRLHPEYIYNRIKALGHSYDLRILLVLVDIDNHEPALLALHPLAHHSSLTLLLSWSTAEAARYLESYKILEHTPPTLIREKPKADYTSRMVDMITAVRSISKADAISLVGTFGSVRGAVNAETEEVVLMQGWGEKKAGRWTRAVREGFRTGGAKGRKEDGEGEGRQRGTGRGDKRGDERVRAKLGIGEVRVDGENGWEGAGAGTAPGRRQADEEDEDALMAEREMSVVVSRPSAAAKSSQRKAGTGGVSREQQGIMDAIARLRQDKG